MPNLPYNDPEFIEAYERAVFAHETGTQAVESFGLMGDITTVESDCFSLAKNPDAVGFSASDVIRFVVSAKQDQVIIYHIGNLAVDALHNRVVRDKQRYVMMLADFMALNLQQTRKGEGTYQYYGIRTKESLIGLPQNAIYGRITPDEYTVLSAIVERQASLSVTRVIRDTLSINDTEASQWRQDMIKRGWLTHGRPPELTALGLSLLH